MIDGVENLGERVFAVDLDKSPVALGVGVIAEKVGNLLEDNDDSDARQHTFDNGRGKIVPDDTGSQDPKNDLHDSAENNGYKKVLIAS